MDLYMSSNIADTLATLALTANATDSYPLYIVVGVAPCILWLLFYLFQDRHPEPKKEILAVFLLGALMTAPAVALEKLLIPIVQGAGLDPLLTILAVNIVAVAFVEEFFKYFAVWLKEQVINHNYQLDEPVDFVIYMVVSALGFAAVENLLFLLMPDTSPLIARSLVRSATAILLHTLTSGILGYYMAMTFCHRERRTSLLAVGFVVISCLHGLYNFSIMESETNLEFLLVTLSILLFMACTLYIQFQQLLRMKSVCDMKTGPKHK
jgi:protease PrsW